MANEYFRIACRGTKPMLQNPVQGDDLLFLIGDTTSQQSTAANKKDAEKQIAERKLCKGPNGELGFPTTWLLAALNGAGRHVLHNREKMTSLDKTNVPTLVTIIPDLKFENGDGFIPFTNKRLKWRASKQEGSIEGTVIQIIRPLIPTWSFSVLVKINLTRVTAQKVLELFQKAGAQGLGDFRPSLGGKFGSFAVIRCKLVTNPAARSMKKAA